jgi:hypothetical protein
MQLIVYRLRGNKAAVKVRCLILNDDNKNVTELGYSVLHVQDALSCADGEVEASKAVSCTSLIQNVLNNSNNWLGLIL